MLLHPALFLCLYCLLWGWIKVDSNTDQVVWRDTQGRKTNRHQKVPSHSVPFSLARCLDQISLRWVLSQTSGFIMGGIKERPPWRSWCPRAGTEDETQRDGVREEEKSKARWEGESPINGILNHSLPGAAASHRFSITRKWRIRGGGWHRWKTRGGHKRWSKVLIDVMPKIEL